jgi:hypothetical protein
MYPLPLVSPHLLTWLHFLKRPAARPRTPSSFFYL